MCTEGHGVEPTAETPLHRLSAAVSVLQVIEREGKRGREGGRFFQSLCGFCAAQFIHLSPHSASLFPPFPGECEASQQYASELEDVLAHCAPKSGVAAFIAESIQVQLHMPLFL